MKTLLPFVATAIGATSSFGQPATYNFSGHLTSVDRDAAGSIAAGGFAVGAAVAVSFEVDFSKPGRVTLNTGDTIEIPPYVWQDTRIDYFATRMLTGTRLPEVNGGMYNGEEDVSEYLTGWNRTDWRGDIGVLIGGSRDSYFRLERFDPYPGGSVPDWKVQDWQVGTMLLGHIVGWSDLDYSMMTAELRLDSVAPVPEPTVGALLLLSGLFAASGKLRERSPDRRSAGQR